MRIHGLNISHFLEMEKKAYLDEICERFAVFAIEGACGYYYCGVAVRRR